LTKPISYAKLTYLL